MRSLRVLYITNQLPWPADSGGQRREYELLRRLSLSHQIHLVTVGPKTDTRPARWLPETKLPHLLADVTQFGIPRKDRTPGETMPIRMADHYSAEAEQFIQARVESIRPDVIHVEGFFLMYSVPDSPSAPPVVLAEENIEFSLAERGCELPSFEILRAAEFLSWQRAAVIVAVCEEDAAAISARTGGSVIVAPNAGSHITRPPEAGDDPQRMTAGYLGGYAWPPSRAAGELLITRIWPMIRRRVACATLDIVGVGWPEELSDPSQGIVIRGSVPRVADALGRLAVFLCPTEKSSGSKLKMHEALRMGCPIVTFPGGIGGFPDPVKGAVALADGLEQFADLAAEVLLNGDLRQQVRVSALKIADSLPTWDDSAVCVDRALKAAAQ